MATPNGARSDVDLEVAALRYMDRPVVHLDAGWSGMVELTGSNVVEGGSVLVGTD
jgi:hypothetical protein